MATCSSMDCEPNTSDKPPQRARAIESSSPDTDCIRALVTGTLIVSGDSLVSGGRLLEVALKRTNGANRLTLSGKQSREAEWGMRRNRPKVRRGAQYT